MRLPVAAKIPLHSAGEKGTRAISVNSVPPVSRPLRRASGQ
jgi:hypothetical protein